MRKDLKPKIPPISALNPTIVHYPGMAERKMKFLDLLLSGAYQTDVPSHCPHRYTMLASHGLIQPMAEHDKVQCSETKELTGWVTLAEDLLVGPDKSFLELC